MENVQPGNPITKTAYLIVQGPLLRLWTENPKTDLGNLSDDFLLQPLFHNIILLPSGTVSHRTVARLCYYIIIIIKGRKNKTYALVFYKCTLFYIYIYIIFYSYNLIPPSTGASGCSKFRVNTVHPFTTKHRPRTQIFRNGSKLNYNVNKYYILPTCRLYKRTCISKNM